MKALRESFRADAATFDVHTLRAALAEQMGERDTPGFYGKSRDYQEFLLRYYLNLKSDFISGHFPISADILKEYYETHSFFTLFREPLARFQSQYIYDKMFAIREIGQSQQLLTKEEREEELQSYLKSYRARFVSNIYTWMLGGPVGSSEGEFLEQAKENLEFFSCIGFQDQMDRFEKDIDRHLGIPLSIGVKNTTPFQADILKVDIDDYRSLFTNEVKEQIRELCVNDCDLYNYARNRSGEQ